MRAYVCIVLLVACGAPDQADELVQQPDFDEFSLLVQPILERQCGNPACHGALERPFSVYSERNWREDSDNLYLPVPLTENELLHNYTAACVMLSDARSPQEVLLLRKPLGDAADTYHGGGEIFVGKSDRSYRVLLDWIAGGWNEQQ